MVEMSRSAVVVWTGDLVHGTGHFTVGSGVIREASVTWSARVESPGGKTRREELIGGGDASWYAMGLSHTRTEAGHAPQRLDVTAHVTASLDDDGLRIVESALRVRGDVPGVDAGQFVEFAAKGE